MCDEIVRDETHVSQDEKPPPAKSQNSEKGRRMSGWGEISDAHACMFGMAQGSRPVTSLARWLFPRSGAANANG